MKNEKFMFKPCTPVDLDTIINIETEALNELTEPDLLRKNTKEMLLECLSPPHYTLGAWDGRELAAFSVLYLPHDETEDLSYYLQGITVEGFKTANYKLCIVKKVYRGRSLQYKLGHRLEKYAVDIGIQLLCATVSPKNAHSLRNLNRLGFIYNRTLEKYGYTRQLFYKYL